MISLVLDAARRVLEPLPGHDAAGIGVIAVLLAIVLIAERELLRAFGGRAAAYGLRATGAIVFPLLFAVVLILGVRFGRFV